jgi:hypothetical protein
VGVAVGFWDAVGANLRAGLMPLAHIHCDEVRCLLDARNKRPATQPAAPAADAKTAHTAIPPDNSEAAHAGKTRYSLRRFHPPASWPR